MKKLMILVAGALMTIAPAMAARRVVVVGGPVVGGFYGPAFYGPWWGPAYGPYAYAAPYASTGEIKIETKAKDAQVFVNGAFAGTVKDVHNMHLRPGSYTIEVRRGEQPGFSEKVYVVAGKTVHIYPAV